MSLDIEPNKFFQFPADCIDIIVETLEGKGTFNTTQMVVSQRGSTKELSLDLSMGKENRLDVPDTLQDLTSPPHQLQNQAILWMMK